MKILRIFMHPDGDTFIDMGVAEGVAFNMAAFWNAVKQDGGVVAEGAMIPTSTIHHVAVLEAVVQQTNFTVVPGGKPN